MIAEKRFDGDGINTRFLSDFIIQSEQFCRVYNYIYDIGGVEGDIDPTTGLYIRVIDYPSSEDLVTIDKWDLVDNSISFYVPPQGKVYIEVATTPEEFGTTLTQPSVEKAKQAAEEAKLSAEASEQSAVNSANSATASANSASAASNSASNASSSSSSAATSAASANSAASAASTSASNASSSANNAQSSAGSAASSASAASTSKNQAAASASNALASESRADSSETEAAASAAEAAASASSIIDTDFGIESGNNSNGYYIKYADGTLIQWRSIVQISADVSSTTDRYGVGTGDLSTYTKLVTFPIPFLDVNYTVITDSTRIDEVDTYATIFQKFGFMGSVVIGYGLSGGYGYLKYVAFGKWK